MYIIYSIFHVSILRQYRKTVLKERYWSTHLGANEVLLDVCGFISVFWLKRNMHIFCFLACFKTAGTESVTDARRFAAAFSLITKCHVSLARTYGPLDPSWSDFPIILDIIFLLPDYFSWFLI